MKWLDRGAFLAVAWLACWVLWALHVALRPATGATVSMEFPSRLGTVHVLAQLGTLTERDEAIRRWIDDSVAVRFAIERTP